MNSRELDIEKDQLTEIFKDTSLRANEYASEADKLNVQINAGGIAAILTAAKILDTPRILTVFVLCVFVVGVAAAQLSILGRMFGANIALAGLQKSMELHSKWKVFVSNNAEIF